MNTTQAYDAYLQNLLEISALLSKIDSRQSAVDQDERNAVSGIENNYMTLSQELQTAKNTVRAQYQSVLDSCLSSAGLRRPSDMRPAATTLSWKQAVQQQEQAASKIRDWIVVKTQEAYQARQRKVQEEQNRKAAIAAAEAEAAREKAEQAAAQARADAEALVKSLKQKHRNHL